MIFFYTARTANVMGIILAVLAVFYHCEFNITIKAFTDSASSNDACIRSPHYHSLSFCGLC